MPLSTRQMLWLKMRHRVYFPWKVYAELDPQPPLGRQVRPRGQALHAAARRRCCRRRSRSSSGCRSRHVGRCNVMGLEAHDHGTVHRDGVPAAGRRPDPFLTICPRGDKRLYVMDEAHGRADPWSRGGSSGSTTTTTTACSRTRSSATRCAWTGPSRPEFERAPREPVREAAVSESDPRGPGRRVREGRRGRQAGHRGRPLVAPGRCMDEDRQVQRRRVLVGLARGGRRGGRGSPRSASAWRSWWRPRRPPSTPRNALAMQRQYGWDFGARGVALVFDGKAEGPFVRAELRSWPR